MLIPGAEAPSARIVKRLTTVRVAMSRATNAVTVPSDASDCWITDSAANVRPQLFGS